MADGYRREALNQNPDAGRNDTGLDDTGLDDANLVEGDPLIKPSSTEHPLYEDVVGALKTVFDPEIPVNIWDLGLVYTISITDDNAVYIDMTLTAPGCPVAGEIPGWVADAVEPLPGVKTVDVEIVWDPPWDMSRMTDEARLELGMY